MTCGTDMTMLLTDAVSANLLMNTELNTPIPTKNEKILQISYYTEIPVEHTILQI